MALFFDIEWFDARLADRGLTRAALAAAARISEPDLALAFKDQRELSAAEVAAFAELLGEPAGEVATRAGVSTRAPGQSALEKRLAAIEARLAAIEARLASEG
ncbi:DNA-binding protein [Phenylobacterium montanum]|uniref:DNA-binding protein n=1 Tax=Phenylobacterium montanum TaxID=2823693 RepID=A0A975IT25_9CAUL|nr:DNA-binding protein [Caulobacter sp. S6]QUD86343.1 DNA-binding protein [Caulobacter sp. S6]